MAVGLAIIVVVAAAAGAFVYQSMTQPMTQPGVTSSSQPSEGTITIGFISTLTGPTSSTGRSHFQGAELAVHDINNNGGVLGRNMSLIIEDEGGSSAETVSATSRLIAAHPFAIVGYYFSGDFLAAEPLIVSNKMLTILAEPNAPSILAPLKNDSSYRYIFQMQTIAGAGAPLIGFVADVVKAKTFISVSENYGWARLENQYVEQQLAAKGIQKLTADYLPADTADYSTEIAKIASLQPDAVYVCMSGTNDVLFQKQWVQNPTTAKIPIIHIGSGGSEKPSVIRDMIASQPGAADYDAQATLGLPNMVKTDKTLAYYSEYQNAYGEPAALFADGVVYDSVMLLAQAIKTAGVLDVNAVISVLETQTYQGVVGTWKFGPDHLGIWEAPQLIPAVIEYVPSGSTIITNIVWPSQLANGTYVHP